MPPLRAELRDGPGSEGGTRLTGVGRNAAYELHSVARYQATHGRPGLFSTPDAGATAQHLDSICEIEIGPQYRAAFKRWEGKWERLAKREVEMRPRVLIGLSEASLWETSIALHLPYGVPLLPGSACKGLARHFALMHLVEMSDRDSDGAPRPYPSSQIFDVLFGTTACRGVVEFKDAWWVPDSAQPDYGKARPFVREVVTPHHKKFMQTGGASPATPFDNPEPSPQIAAHGKFLLIAEGTPLWAEHALDILQLALEFEGIGARTPEYGRVSAP